jgi:gamma-glutamylcyclotransferase (GGCT)/AIG2-like uncharacterized protein YtfP
MENNIQKLFVYGSLRKGFPNPVYEYISKYFTFLGEAKVHGMLYDLGEYPAAVPATSSFLIKGELYELKKPGEFERTMKQLDDYEGLYPDEGETQLYKREVTDVFYQKETVRAWIYWYNLEVSGEPIKPSGDTFDYLTYKSQ